MADWKDGLIKIAPYVAGEQPKRADLIKLNANENPYPPSPRVIDAIHGFDGADLRRYPNADALPLMEAIAEDLGTEPKNVFVGNGSDDVLALCFRAFFGTDRPVLLPDITYSFYPVWCRMYGIPFETIPVDE
ncbi:MAG: aminotransferase class I/II-fold pyridoxal phosphate-dependent enzyme, partial [Oscillospiraceae bacterium]|nr:aminotransferase class I/II-fold pyridoxal phosphate-dependent enzyme [Oscillospiraceae bacterium]